MISNTLIDVVPTVAKNYEELIRGDTGKTILDSEKIYSYDDNDTGYYCTFFGSFDKLICVPSKQKYVKDTTVEICLTGETLCSPGLYTYLDNGKVTVSLEDYTAGAPIIS